MKSVAVLFALGCVVASAGANDVQKCLAYQEVNRPYPMTQINESCINGGIGCNALNIVECQLCGFDGYLPCQNTQAEQTCLSFIEADRAYPMTQINKDCINGGLGCKALDIDECQFCGFEGYPACNTPVAVASEEVEADARRLTANTEEECLAQSASSGLSAYWDKECDTLNAPIGCGAFGIQNCRFCGFGLYSDLVCPTESACGVDAEADYAQCAANQQPNGEISTEWDVACANGGVGCDAHKLKCCRYCSVSGNNSPYVPCTKPFARKLQEVSSADADFEQCKAAAVGTGINVFYDPECTTVHAAIGCNVFGITKCRVCGNKSFSDVECPVAAQVPVDSMTQCQANANTNPNFSTKVDLACVNGGVGCKPFGIEACRFCTLPGKADNVFVPCADIPTYL